MASASAGDVKSLLQTLETNLAVSCDQLSEDTPSRENDIFNKDTFWNDFIGATKLVSHEATKFCMMFNKKPWPTYEECESLITSIESTCLSLVTVFFSLPKTRGKTLHKEIRLYVYFIIRAVKELCSAAKHESTQPLHTVGNVWEKCEEVESLPKDNRDAVLALCQRQHDTIEDASLELMDAIENEQEEDFELTVLTPRNGMRIPPLTSWTDSDRNVTLPCSGLVKAAKACVHKTLAAIAERADAENARELDAIADIVGGSSALIDDFVLSLYPPVDHSALRHQASLVRTNSKDLLSAVEHSHFCTEADTLWIAFLEKAVDHNWVRINDNVLAD